MRGKFGEHQTVRSILKSLPKTVHSDVTRAGIGEDYARLLLYSGEDINVATGVCGDLGEAGLRLDISRLYNSLRIGGYEPWAATDTIVMPDSDERRMKKLLRKLAGVCAEYGVDIAAGHTEVNSSVMEPIISITMIGRKSKPDTDGLCADHKNAAEMKAGADIVMCGQTGVGGTLQLYFDHQKELFSRYSESYLRPVEQLGRLITLGKQVDIAYAHGISYAHDISRGGVFAALWEMGDALGTGLCVCHDDIPILQETIEICEHTGDNPYMIDGCGAALFVTADGGALSDELYEAGYEAAVIGHLTEESDRVVTHDDERRFLTPPRYL